MTFVLCFTNRGRWRNLNACIALLTPVLTLAGCVGPTLLSSQRPIAMLLRLLAAAPSARADLAPGRPRAASNSTSSPFRCRIERLVIYRPEPQGGRAWHALDRRQAGQAGHHRPLHGVSLAAAGRESSALSPSEWPMTDSNPKDACRLTRSVEWCAPRRRWRRRRR